MNNYQKSIPMKKIFIICVEKSGDLISSEVVKEMSLDNSNFEIYGIFGKQTENQCKINNIEYKKLYDIEKLSIIGFIEVLPKLFSIIKIIKKTAKEILTINPNLVLTIDGYDFCSRVVKKVFDCNKNISFFHAVAPSVWAYNEKRIDVIQKYYKDLFCLLPFEKEIFENNKLNVHFVGYPAVFKHLPNKINYDNYIANNFKPERRIVSITLGSRMQEISNHLPIITKVITNISNYDQNIDFFILSTVELESKVINLIKNNTKNVDKISIISNEEEKVTIAKKSALIIAKSGTNTMEFVSIGIPLIVYYKVSKINMFVLIKIKKLKIRLVNLFNIYKKKEIIPEFVFDNKCTAKEISKQAITYLNNSEELSKQLLETSEVVKMAKEKKSEFYIAKIIIDFLK